MQTIQEIFIYLIEIMGSIIALLIGIALLGFLIGVLRYFTHKDSQEMKKRSIAFMTYGLISLFVITSVWGLVHLLSDTIGVDIPTRNGGDVFRSVSTDGDLDPTLGSGNDEFFGDNSDTIDRVTYRQRLLDLVNSLRRNNNNQ